MSHKRALGASVLSAGVVDVDGGSAVDGIGLVGGCLIDVS
jgi:hypothetical protein